MSDTSLLNKGAWLLFPVSYSDDKCISDFEQEFGRLPEHVIFDPKTPRWKFAGPVWTDEELERRRKP